MKKILLTCLLLFTTSLFFADASKELKTPDPSCKIVYYEGKEIQTDESGEGKKTHPYWFNQGVDLEKYDMYKDPGLEELTKNEIEKVKAAEEYNKNYYVVGHSQGGPRTLAYAAMLKKLSENDSSYDYSQLKGVFTVSGIDRGAKILEGGFGNIKRHFTEMADQLMDCTRGIICCFGTLGNAFFKIAELSRCAGFFSTALTGKSLVNWFLRIVIGICDGFDDLFDINWYGWDTANYIIAAWDDTGELKQLRDMQPRSSFFEEYVIDSQKETKKKQTGSKLTCTWKTKKVGLLKIPYLEIKTVPVYKYYDVYHDNEAKFDDDLYAGYITGSQSGILGLTKKWENGEINTDAYKALRTTIDDVIPAVAGTAALINTAEAVVCTCTLNLIQAAIHTEYAVECNDCRVYFDNFDRHMNEMIGETENDGLVAKSCQTIPLKQHSKVIGTKDFPEFSHTTIPPVEYFSPKDRKPIEDSQDPEDRVNGQLSFWMKLIDKENEIGD